MKRVLHCWEPSEPDEHGDRTGVCLLEDGHEGPHQFTPGDQVQVTFATPEDGPEADFFAALDSPLNHGIDK